MIKILALIFTVFSFSSLATTPFSLSGDAISAVFSSPKVWKNVSSPVKNIEHINHINSTSTYLVKTSTCNFIVKVTLEEKPSSSSSWVVTSSESTHCKL